MGKNHGVTQPPLLKKEKLRKILGTLEEGLVKTKRKNGKGSPLGHRQYITYTTQKGPPGEKERKKGAL